MADFVQTMKDWRRMCQAQDDGSDRDVCATCPIGTGCAAIYECDMDYAKVERVASQWAVDHPEPVYPTWGEWFVSRGMLPEKWDNLTSAYMDVGCVPNLIHSPIPADIAQKLGIEPKEG